MKPLFQVFWGQILGWCFWFVTFGTLWYHTFMDCQNSINPKMTNPLLMASKQGMGNT
jgi:hypothetical protein